MHRDGGVLHWVLAIWIIHQVRLSPSSASRLLSDNLIEVDGIAWGESLNKNSPCWLNQISLHPSYINYLKICDTILKYCLKYGNITKFWLFLIENIIIVIATLSSLSRKIRVRCLCDRMRQNIQFAVWWKSDTYHYKMGQFVENLYPKHYSKYR